MFDKKGIIVGKITITEPELGGKKTKQKKTFRPLMIHCNTFAVDGEEGSNSFLMI